VLVEAGSRLGDLVAASGRARILIRAPRDPSGPGWHALRMLPLTDQSRRALRFARGEAEAVGHDYVGTADVLLGLLSEREGAAARALGSLGFHREEVTRQLRGLRGAEEPPAGPPSRFSRPAELAVGCALQEARVLERSHAGTEHLLLGLMRAAQTHGDTAFMRIVGFEDQLRIRNEILRLVVRPPNAAEVARRKAMHAAGPHSEFEAYALGLLHDA